MPSGFWLALVSGDTVKRSQRSDLGCFLSVRRWVLWGRGLLHFELSRGSNNDSFHFPPQIERWWHLLVAHFRMFQYFLLVSLCGPTDCNSPGSSVHGMFQARIWSGLPFPTPEDLPDQELNLCLLSLLYWHEIGRASCRERVS